MSAPKDRPRPRFNRVAFDLDTQRSAPRHRIALCRPVAARWYAMHQVDRIPANTAVPAAAWGAPMDPSRREPYEVTDLSAAAALVAAGCRLAAIERDARGARPTRFLFDPDDRLAATLQHYHHHTLTVDPGLYADAIRKLRPWSNATTART